ncbi:hypothetical protein Vafri_21594 [Volvox africanus]|uniref:Kinesin motor domain-containing protein n=1 Tax=Volvox africanus TaxID=51714 RepID=A0A8J4FBI0_9CHLO|nr:hypothetical protein Vafri_21594 [Volvox africanus]
MVNGFNSTVFAYGQTSSGKTHTMRGSHDSPGIIPLAVSEAFSLIEANESREYLIRVSYMEIYNEDINDLLAPENVKLPIKEGPYGPYVCGLREDIVTSPEQVLELLTTGEANRHIGSTKMNEKSSRSHTIFRMVVESRAVDAESDDAGAVLVSALSLVDLAGSERVAKTGAEGIRMKEGTAINKSLLTLGNVINKLSEGALATGGHIPYRDSKLTRILQPSLGGNAKTAIICAMTPAWCHREESHITLRFACRAKSVVNNAIVNEVLSDAAVLKRQAKEIEELKRQLAGGNGGCKNTDEQINGLRAQLLRSEQEKELIKAKLEEEKELIKAKLEEEQQEKEKAQREAENAKKLFFQSREEPSEGGSRRNNRRETWCPGKSAWAMPHEQSLTETTTNSGGGDSSQRKRALGRLDGDGIARGLSTLLEEDEEDGDVAEGPTPQRRRREYSAMSDYIQDEDVEHEEFDMHRNLERIMSSLPAQERIALSHYLQQHQEVEERVEALGRELMERERLAAQQAESDRSALDVLAQQLEQAKWQARQFERKVEDLQASCRSAEEARDALSISNAELESAMEAKCNDFNNRFKELTEKCAAAKEAAQTLKAELIDTRAALEKREYEFGRLEAKEADTKAKLDEAEAKYKQKTDEVEGFKTMAHAAEERTLEAEKRARVLYEEVQRLEVHVQELESRKRAPLYQKKQEEELKAAVEKAKECEVRTLEAELRSKELRASVEALQKELVELQDTSAAGARQAAQAHEDLVERHALELQRLTAASALQQERHEEAVANLRVLIDELESTKTSLGEQVQAKDQQLSGIQIEAAALRGRIGELEAQEVELQACAVAAQEKIAHLEQEAEAQAAAHEAALAALEQQYKDALAQNEQAQKEALSSVIAQHDADTAALEGKIADLKASNAHLDTELCAARERADLLVKASLEQSQAATVAQAELQRQLAELSAKVQEAAGALKAKEELKEERLRSKQEISNLKSELQKLQLESKSGAKGKDLAQKELETLKKRLTDTETKLRTALQEKTAALLEKSNFERQLKQNQSQKLMIEKTLEKKDAIESKKRESIMVKSKEQLNSIEERLRSAQVELQKLQMDMTAKQCECSGLEEQLNEQKMQNVRLQDENEQLTNECTDLRLQLHSLSDQHKDTTDLVTDLRCQCDALLVDKESLLDSQQKLQSELHLVMQQQQQERSVLQEQVNQQKVQNVQVQDENDQLVKECTDLRSQLDSLSNQLKTTTDLVTDLRCQCDALLVDKESLLDSQQKLQSKLQLVLQQQQQACNVLQEQVNQQMVQNVRLQDENDQLIKECTDLRLQLDNQSIQHKQTTDLVTDLRCQCNALLMDNEALLESQQKLHSELQLVLQQKQDTEQQAQHTVKLVSEEKRCLESMLKTAQEALVSAQEELTKYQATEPHCHGQRDAIQEVNQESDMVQARMSFATTLENEQCCQASLAELRCQYDALLRANEALQSAHGSVAEAGQQARDELAAMSMRLASLEEEKQALCSQLAAAEEALDVARVDLSAAVSLHAAVQGKLHEDASVEATKLSAALFGANQQTEALKAELDSVRAQLREAQSIGDLANTTCDLTRSLSGPIPRLLPMDELQRQLNELTAANQELDEMVFSMTEREDAAQKLQAQLKSQLAAADLELARRCQQVAELQKKCADLEEELTAVRKLVSVISQPGPEAQADSSVASQALQDKLTKLAAERDSLAARLTEVLSAQEELKCGISEHVQQREQLLHAIDDLSAQLANKEDGVQQQLERERVLQVARQDAEEQAAVLQGRNLKLEAAVEEHVLRCQELASQLTDLQYRYDILQQKHSAMEQELAELRDCSGAAPLETGASADNIEPVAEDAHYDPKTLRMWVAELQQRQAELEAEMSDVQAACNVAIAEKHTLEQTTTHRMLELETANIRLQDTIAKLQGERGPLPMEMDDSLLECEELSRQVQHLTVSLENAIVAKDEACKRLEAELGVLRSALASAEESNAHLEEARRKLEEEVKCAGGKNFGLKEALAAATAAVADAERHASDQVNDAKNALSSLLLSYDQLVTQNSQLEIKLNDKSADVEVLRAGLAQAVEKRKEAERQSDDLANTISELRAELQVVQATLEETVVSRNEVAKRIADAEARINLCQQLEIQVSSLQAAVKRLTEEAAESKEAAASLDNEVQELLDANTLLESQVRELRAQLASRPSEIDHAEAASLAARLSESEALRYKLEQQVAEIAQQMSTASAQQRAGARERAELENNFLAAKEACAGLEAKLSVLIKKHKEVVEENRLLNEELKAAREQLQASGGESVVERLHELQSQLQMQEDRHRVATDRMQKELEAVQKQMGEKQQEFTTMEASLRRHIQDMSYEFEKLQDSHEECQLLAKQREAELNAQKLALQSQIHWLTENKERLENVGPPPPPAVPDARLNALEEELRRAKRAEQKLQGLLFRIRKDFEDSNNGVNIQNLMDMRSLQYDVDMLTQKCKRLQREIQVRDDEHAQLQTQLEEQERQLATMVRCTASKAQTLSSGGPTVLVDKENMPYR